MTRENVDATLRQHAQEVGVPKPKRIPEAPGRRGMQRPTDAKPRMPNERIYAATPSVD